MFYHRQPATGVPEAVICSEGYQRMQELGSKRRETTIYTGSARQKVTAPYVQSRVDSMLRPALCRPLDPYRDQEVFCCGVFLCRSVDLGTPALLYIVQERRKS